MRDPAKHYVQACEHPRYGLIVHRKGNGPSGTRLTIVGHSTSMSSMPRNLGVSNVRRAISNDRGAITTR